jgi:DNA (cytosine-5)-methyltransferase 1
MKNKNEHNKPEKAAPTFIDLFAGCGGLSFGLLQAGWRGICAIEKTKDAFETLKANLIDGKRAAQFDWPESLPKQAMTIATFLRHLSNAAVARDLVGKVDLVAGGPPCQGFSFAGKRQHDDPRNRLFTQYTAVVKAIRPRLLLIENVQGVAVKHGERRLPYSRKILRALKKIGYECYVGIHRAADFGVPQERPRCFFIGVDVERYPHATAAWLAKWIPEHLEAARNELLAEKGLVGAIPVSVRHAIADLRISRRGAVLQPAEVPRRLELKYAVPRQLPEYVKALRQGPRFAMDSMRLASHSKEIKAKWKRLIRYCTRAKRRGVSLKDDERSFLDSNKSTIVVLNPRTPSHTLTSLPDDLIHYCEPRILTVREYARLQSFPDWFVFRGKYTTGGELRRKDCPRYTQVANAVAPFVAEALGFTLRHVQREILWLHGLLAPSKAAALVRPDLRKEPAVA